MAYPNNIINYRKQVKIMKRFLTLLLCLCLPLTAVPSAFAAQNSEVDEVKYDPAEVRDQYDDRSSVFDMDENYAGWGTVYDLENEFDMPFEPEEFAPPQESVYYEDDESEIYNDNVFDNENAIQLNNREYVPDEILLKFKEPGQVPGKEKQLQKEISKVEKLGFVNILGVYVVRVEDLDTNPNAVLNRLKNNKYIEYVEPNYTFKTNLIPNDPNYAAQALVLTMINAQAGWDIISGSSKAIIAVVDTGVASHPDLPPLLNGYSAVAGLSPNNDKQAHGTGVAGTIGAVGNNRIGGAGINWNASIMPVKVDDSNGTLSVSNIAKGIIWAADNGAKIINISLGMSGDSITLKNAIDYAYNKGCAIFAAAGDNGKNEVNYPARYANVMAVGSTVNGTSRAITANYGAGLNAVAYGGYYTTTAAGGYGNMSGTSFATAQVAGLASLIWALNPGFINDDIYLLTEYSSKALGGGINEQTGYGLINVGKTLQIALSSEIITPGEEVPDPDPLLPESSPQEIRTPPVITLTGFTDLTLKYGQAYNEMGYFAVDCKGLNLTSSVVVTNTVDIWKDGIYTITYEVADSAGITARATRTVTVNPQPPAPEPASAPKITIIGSDPIVLHQTSSTPYEEQSARAIDNDGTDISRLVRINGTVNRYVAGTYKLTYSVTSPTTGLSAATTRDVRIIAPAETVDPRTKYGFSGQAKAGAKITHTGIVSGATGFMDLKVASIDNKATINVQLVDTATKKAVMTDAYSAVGAKQYSIGTGKYELVVTITQANGNSKYSVELLMPETTTVAYNEAERSTTSPKIMYIGSNPIVLHLNSATPYYEQGARAVNYDGTDISKNVEIIGRPDRNTKGTYKVTYRVTNELGLTAEIERNVQILAPGEFEIGEAEIPLPKDPEASVNPVKKLGRKILGFFGKIFGL
jgi:subtilisin family serine protease